MCSSGVSRSSVAPRLLSFIALSLYDVQRVGIQRFGRPGKGAAHAGDGQGNHRACHAAAGACGDMLHLSNLYVNRLLTQIRITTDLDRKTITIADTGIGMTKQEVRVLCGSCF
jgi:hypothetical protein